MKKRIKYFHEPMVARVIKDFLPRPESLVVREKKQRVTLTLTKRSLDFFKSAAKRQKASYQGMIRMLVDYYAANQKL